MGNPHDAEFTREHGCSESDWLRCLPGAVNNHMWTLMRPGKVRVMIGGGTLTLRWNGLPPRRLGQAVVPRLSVHYLFDGVNEVERVRFLDYFDLYLQRGGG